MLRPCSSFRIEMYSVLTSSLRWFWMVRTDDLESRAIVV